MSKMVEFLLGKREFIAMGEESTYGTSATRDYRFGRNAKWEPKNNNNFQEILQAGADNLNVSRELGPLSVGGTLRFAPQDWRLLYYALGSVNTTGTDPYTHTFTNSATLPSFTLERAIQHTTDRVRTYAGCKINTFTLNWTAGASAGGSSGLAEAVAEVIAQSVTNGTSTTSITAPTDLAFQFRHAKLTLNSTEITETLNGTITVENNLHDARYANSTVDRTIGEPEPQIRRFTGNFVINIKDDTYFDFWDAGTVLSGTNTLEFIRSANDKVTFTFNNIVIPNAPDPTNLEGINTVTLNWEAESVSAVAVDSISSYP